jgi:putative ABC transport system permease protein
VANSSGSFTRGNNVSIQRMQDHSSMFIYMISIDNDYIPVMGMEVVKGEAFADDHTYDNKIIMINEALMRKLNIEDSIGVRLGRTIGWIEHPVVLGVVKNFHHQSLQSEIEPMMFLHEQPLNNSYLMIRLASGQLVNGIKKIQGVWEKFIPDSPFEYFFLDDDIAKQYSSELRWSRIITLATGMAIFLSALGLVGLAMYTAEQRKREIGIRKVMGASLHQIITLLSKDYMWLVAIAFLIAAPASYYVMMRYWLDNFAFRIKIDFPIYLTAFLIVLPIVALAIGSQTIRAAIQNPAETLKEE